MTGSRPDLYMSQLARARMVFSNAIRRRRLFFNKVPSTFSESCSVFFSAPDWRAFFVAFKVFLSHCFLEPNQKKPPIFSLLSLLDPRRVLSKRSGKNMRVSSPLPHSPLSPPAINIPTPPPKPPPPPPPGGGPVFFGRLTWNF